MDHSWVSLHRLHDGYSKGVGSFLESAQKNPEFNGFMRCPCRRCGNLTKLQVEEVRNHLFFNGFDLTYTRWIWHGEATSSFSSENVRSDTIGVGVHEEIDIIEKLREDIGIDAVEK